MLNHRCRRPCCISGPWRQGQWLGSCSWCVDGCFAMLILARRWRWGSGKCLMLSVRACNQGLRDGANLQCALATPERAAAERARDAVTFMVAGYWAWTWELWERVAWGWPGEQDRGSFKDYLSIQLNAIAICKSPWSSGVWLDHPSPWLASTPNDGKHGDQKPITVWGCDV